MLGFSQRPEERSRKDFWSYYCFIIPSRFPVFTVSKFSHRDKNGTCVCHQHVPVYVHYLWKAGCRRPEAVIAFAFPLQAQAEIRHRSPTSYAAGDTMMFNRYPSFSGAAPGFKSPSCASQRNPLRCHFVLEFRNNITDYVIVLCTLHWQSGIF